MNAKGIPAKTQLAAQGRDEQTGTAQKGTELIGKLKGDKGGLKNRIGQLEGQLKGSGEKNSGLSKQLAQAKSEIGKLKGDKGGLKDKIGQLEGQLKGAGEKNKGLSKNTYHFTDYRRITW